MFQGRNRELHLAQGGEEAFKERARLIRRYGAAVVVMAFDEEGQAATGDRKVAICTRAYKILTEEVGFPPQDIIFDPNILTVATGIEEHDQYAVAFLEATRRIKATLPLAKVSGGLSNISFSFRGNAPCARRCIRVPVPRDTAGMDMGIVNAGAARRYEEIPKDLLELVEDVLLNRGRTPPSAWSRSRNRSSRRTRARARRMPGGRDGRGAPQHALVKGIADYVEVDTEEARKKYDRPCPSSRGRSWTDDRGRRPLRIGRMFLPQVVKSAR